jgi:hypothetical protein
MAVWSRSKDGVYSSLTQKQKRAISTLKPKDFKYKREDGPSEVCFCALPLAQGRARFYLTIPELKKSKAPKYAR